MIIFIVVSVLLLFAQMKLPEEKEVAFASYASSNDKMLQKAEKTMRVRKGVNVIKEGNN